MSKLWEKGIATDAMIEQFTVGKDRDMDMYLASFDIVGSLAHGTMLAEIGLLTSEEFAILEKELRLLYAMAVRGELYIEEGVEDIHSQVELMLTRSVGDVGKKIHSGRSRNDQVLVDIRLFLRSEIQRIVERVKSLFERLMLLSEEYKDVLLPGYTHFQAAMPSSFGLWFGAYAESLLDDIVVLHGAYSLVNKNPLGSAAGYGSSFPLNRRRTTQLLGFDDLNYNVVYAQMTRGKVERIVAGAYASIAATLAKLSADVCLYMSQNFGFVTFPDEFTTGSSIMPHKKNPDIFELVRAKSNKIQALPNTLTLLTANLPSGYHRDLQILKEELFPAGTELLACLEIAEHALAAINITPPDLSQDTYKFIFSVEEVNRRVLEGLPFRDAYKAVAADIAAGTFSAPETLHHTHEGSLGNLCNEHISKRFQEETLRFSFGEVEQCINSLVGQLATLSK